MKIRFSDLSGHAQQIEILKHAMSQNRVAQAYLMTGVEGIGKRQIALATIAALNCGEQTGEACGNCANCRAMLREEHPDITILAPEGRSIKIEAVRQIQRRLHYTPLLGRWKAIIIDDCHTLGEAAANALLKTLEEPSGQTVFFLITSQTHLLLDTILSRCQRLSFAPLPIDELTAQLIEQAEIDQNTARVVASMSEGSLGKALVLADGKLLELRDQMIKLLDGLPRMPMQTLFEASQRLCADKEELRERLDILRLYVRDLVLCANGMPPEDLTNVDRQDDIARQVAGAGEELTGQLQLISETEELLDRNVNPRLAVDHLLMSLKFKLSPPPLL